MSRAAPDFKTWAGALVFGGLAVMIGYSLPPRAEPKPVVTAQKPKPQAAVAPAPEVAQAPAATPAPVRAASVVPPEATPAAFVPPSVSDLADGGFKDMVQRGEAIFHDTKTNAGQFVGNDLACSNCHIDRGKLANSAPLWAAYVQYPAYRAKNGHVNTFQERLQGCFSYSMNGKAPPTGDDVLVALETYAYFLAKGAPTGTDLPGRGYPKLAKPEGFDKANGEKVYEQKCALCHGGNGEGQKTAGGATVFPPLWGSHSYNWGAGMGSINNAAGFIKANMPLSQGNSLTDKEAWDVAAFVDSHERPQDPRFKGSVEETRKAHHGGPMDLYGTTADGVLLGQNSVPSGPQP